MEQDCSEVNKLIEQLEKDLADTLGKIVLTPDENEFVREAGLKAKNLLWNMLMDVPDERRFHMRALIIGSALASLFGPWQIENEGLAYYSKDKSTPPQV